MRVHVVDPSAYTPPYDHALCYALAAAGAEVELFTSRFGYGAVASPDGYTRTELFYRAAIGAPGGRLRMVSKLAQHVPDMLRYRRTARAADVVHFQWLTVQHVDRYLLPPKRSVPGAGRRAGHPGSSGRPALVLTAHDVLPREPRPGQLRAQRRLYERFDAIVVHSGHGRERLLELGVEEARVHVIPHGAFTHLVGRGNEREGGESMFAFGASSRARAKKGLLRARTRGAPDFEQHTIHAADRDAAPPKRPVVLMFGLMRPYKGIDVLLDAWRSARTGENAIEGAELWIAGMPRMDISALKASSPPDVRWDPRFIADRELSAYFERADLVVLPYLQADQSGVLFTALAFGKPLLLSDVGGFPELAQTGAARIVPAGDTLALSQALRELLADPVALGEMGAKARAAAEGRYSWDSIARTHMQLYGQLLQEVRRQ